MFYKYLKKITKISKTTKKLFVIYKNQIRKQKEIKLNLKK